MCFDPDTDKWTQKAPMTTVRGLHCMCTVGDKLYVIGGNHFRGTSDYDDVLSCEYYSTTLDQWTPIAAMLRGQSDVGVAVFENKIYVVGGYSWNNRCMVEIVQKYDPEKDEWHKVFDLPESLGGIRACTLTVFPPEDNTGSPSRESPLSAPQKHPLTYDVVVTPLHCIMESITFLQQFLLGLAYSIWYNYWKKKDFDITCAVCLAQNVCQVVNRENPVLTRAKRLTDEKILSVKCMNQVRY